MVVHMDTAAKKPATNTFETRLKNRAGKVIKNSVDHAKELGEVICMAASFAIFHGRCDYLNDLDEGLSKNDRNRLQAFLNIFNRNGAKTLFENVPEEWSKLSPKVSRTGGIALFVMEQDKEILIKSNKDNESVKIFKPLLMHHFQTEDGLAEALAPFIEAGDDRITAAVNKAFSMDDFLSNVVKTIARKEGPINFELARSTIHGINRMIQDKDKQMSDDELNAIVERAKNDNNPSPDSTQEITADTVKENLTASQEATEAQEKPKANRQRKAA